MEIEMKVPFGVDKLQQILGKVKSDPKYSVDEFVKKSDSFFTDLSDEETKRRASAKGGRVIRLRSNGQLNPSDAYKVMSGNKRYDPTQGEHYFTTKQKTLVGDYEQSVEHESKIEDPIMFSESLKDMGFRCWFNKAKYSLGVFCKWEGRMYHVEIERVVNEASSNKNGVLYVEIENTDSNNSGSAESIISAEKEIFEDLGLNPSNSDNRPWVEILGK